MPLAWRAGANDLADLVQHVGQVGVGLEGGEQDDGLGAEAAGLGVPAREFDGGGGFALAGVGVQEDDGVLVEGAVEQEQGFVAAHEAGVGHVAAEGGVGLDGVQLGRRRVEGRERSSLGGSRWIGRGLIDDGHEPVLQRARLEADPAVGIAGEVLCGLRWRPGRRGGPGPGRRRAGRCIGRR